MATADMHPQLERLPEAVPHPRRRFQRSTTPDRGQGARPAELRKVPLFDIPLAAVTYDRVVEIVNRALANPPSSGITVDAVNTMGMSEGCLDERMHEALCKYDLLVPDGTPLVWCMNAKGADLDDRVYGPYLTDRVLAGLKQRTRVAVIGGFSDAHDWLREVGPTRYPNADFALLYDAPVGPIDEDYVADCMQRIEDSGADLIFVCLGVPRQYYWTALAKPQLRHKVCISVGGAFDLICGAKEYAPEWMQRAGLTWLHRLAQEPKRLGPRYLKYNSAFLWFLLRREVLRTVSPGARARG